MIEIVLGTCLLASIIANAWLVNRCMIRGSEDRRDLTDRVMALSVNGANALVMKNSIQSLENDEEEDSGSQVVYVDEKRQVELQEARQ